MISYFSTLKITHPILPTSVGSGLVSLDKLADTCCLPIRSERMQALKIRFDTLDTGLANSDCSDRLDTNIAAVEECGEAIGGLFVTCCTPKREKLYLELVKNLNNIHTNLWKLKGISH